MMEPVVNKQTDKTLDDAVIETSDAESSAAASPFPFGGLRMWVLWPRQMTCHFADDISKFILLRENCFI